MGNTGDPSALSLEERNFVEVGTFQPSFGFKDFHHAASRMLTILAGAESEASRGSTSRTGRLATPSSSFWWWKPSPSSAEEASSSHAGEGELLLPS
jgi:hypothetical protein